MMYNTITMVAERFKYFLLPFLIASFVAIPIFFAYPQKTNAQAATASCAAAYIGGLLGIGGTAATTIQGGAAQLTNIPVNSTALNNYFGISNTNTGSSASSDASLSFSKCILTPLIEAMAQRILANITSDLVNWIQGGFNGNPAFVTNMGNLLENSADQAIGQFIQSDPDLSFLCSPFSFQIHLALAINFSAQPYAGCTLSDVTKNITDFGNTQDAWNDWLSVTTEPANNQFGAYVSASGALSDKLSEQINEVNNMVNRNGGFLDVTYCQTYTLGTNQCAPGGMVTGTPGSAAQAALGASYNAEFTKIGLATDIDQIISALLNELVTTTLTGPHGLLGSGTPQPVADNADFSTLVSQSSASNASVVSDLNAQIAAATSQEFPGASQATTSSSMTTSFSNAFPTNNPINLTSSSALPTFSVDTTLSGQVAVLNATITLTSENQNYSPSQIFDTNAYALYVGDSSGVVVNADAGLSLIQNGSITFQGIPSSISSFSFNLRPILVNQNPVTPIYNVYDLTITITDGHGNILATQTARLQMLMN